jgi:hypothetical protein
VALAAAGLAACGLSLVGTADGPDAGDARPEGGALDAGSDATADAADAEGLPASDRGKIACASGSCKAGLERCCTDTGGTRCLSYLTTCSATEIDCDETGDCFFGRLCCLGADTSFTSAWSAVCRSSCRSDDAQLCKSDAECSGGRPCQPITCGARLFGTCGGVKPSICP